MKRRRVALTIALVLMALWPWLTAGAAEVCTLVVSAPGPIPDWVQPGEVVCLRGGLYPHGQLRLTTNSAVYQAYPGELPRLIGSGPLEFYGHDVQISGLEIDNSLAGKQPAVVLRGDSITLTASDVHSGVYNGIDVRGKNVTLQGNTIHDFESGVAGDDAQCVNAIANLTAAADGLRLIGNTIYSCSGDGVQAFYANVQPGPVVTRTGLIAGNTFYAGDPASYHENAIDTKWGSWRILDNHISGYGLADIPGTVANGNPALLIHKYTCNTLISGNTISTSVKGISVFGLGGVDSGVAPCNITLSNNTFDRVGPGYLIQVSAGLTSVVISGNQNFPQGLPTATPTATRTATPSLTPTSTATATASPSPTPSATATVTASPSPSPVPTLSGCWDLRGRQPISIPCPN